MPSKDKTKTRSQRVQIRMAPDTLAAVRRAAEIQGRTVGEFLVAAAIKDAHRTIEEAQLIRLSVDDQGRFAEQLIDPHATPPAMKRAFATHERLVCASK